MLSKEREEQIKNCFVDEKVDFKHVEKIDEFVDLLEHIQKRKPGCNNFGENIELDRLIVLDDVSRRKLFNCLTKIRVDMCVCFLYTLPYRTNLANDTSTKKKYLTFFQARYQADNNSEQICYYNRDKKDTTFNSFLAVRKQTSTGNEIIFSIVKYIDKTNINDSIYTNISDELDGLNNNIVQFEQSVQGISENSTGRETTDRTKRRYTKNDRRISKVIPQSNKNLSK